MRKWHTSWAMHGTDGAFDTASPYLELAWEGTDGLAEP